MEMNSKEVLLEDNRSLEDIIKEVAENEGLTEEQVTAMFRKGLREANGVDKVDPKKKAKNRAKNKSAKKSRKKNRK